MSLIRANGFVVIWTSNWFAAAPSETVMEASLT
jgi:hypothetical protein